MNFEKKQDFINLFWLETFLQKNGRPYNCIATDCRETNSPFLFLSFLLFLASLAI